MNGTSILEIYIYSKTNNFICEIKNGTFDTIISNISLGIPSLLLINDNFYLENLFFNGSKNNHFIIVYGFDEINEKFYCYWGDEKPRIIDFSSLTNVWEKTNNILLLIYPSKYDKIP